VFLGLLVLGLLLVDIFVVHRIGRESPRRHVLESAVWIGIALGFGAYVAWTLGHRRAIEYYSAWLIEKSLSADNLFVFAAVFESFGIPRENQRRVLYLGIFGALVFRLLFILAGIGLLERAAWLAYVFGAVLVYTGARLALRRGSEPDPRDNLAVRAAGRLLPLDRDYRGKRFWRRDGRGRFCFTVMFLVLIAIESSDLMFAVDSVPAVLAVTRDRFIAYSSNAFAILGLRALYFVLADAMRGLALIRPALALILLLVGVKMIAGEMVELPVWLPLAVVGLVLGGAVAGSLWMRRRLRARTA
jgi:tellurite resistance protein TerC